MTRHNYLQRRSRLLKSMRAASVSYLWHMNISTPQSRRATTCAAKKLMEMSRDLWKLGTL